MLTTDFIKLLGDDARIGAPLDFRPQSRLSVVLDHRKSTAFRFFRASRAISPGMIGAPRSRIRWSLAVHMALLFCGFEFPAPRGRLLLPQQSPKPSHFGHFATEAAGTRFPVWMLRCSSRMMIWVWRGHYSEYKTRLQLVNFLPVRYLYRASEKRARKPWQNGKTPIHRRPQNVL